jgi:hypothetical protein
MNIDKLKGALIYFLPFIVRGCSSLFNVGVIWFAVFRLGKDLASHVFYIYASLSLVSVLFRLGWEQFTVAKNRKGEILFLNIAVSSLFIYLFIIIAHYFYQDIYLFSSHIKLASIILFINIISNIELLLRVSNYLNRNFLVVLNANMVGIFLASLFFKHLEDIIFFQVLFVLIFMSIALIKSEENIRLTFKFVHPRESLKYFPLALHSVISQNFLQFGLGLIGSVQLIPVAITIQKICGFLTWPLSHSIFVRGHNIRNTKLFFHDKKLVKIMVYIFCILIILTTLWLLFINKHLVISAWILLIGYFVYALRGDLIFRNIYLDRYKKAYQTQLLLLISLALVSFFSSQMHFSIVFLLNALYLILICF